MFDVGDGVSGGVERLPDQVSGPMDRDVADWWVGYTDGRVEAFERTGLWYLRAADEQRGEREPSAARPGW